jgi:hypothetical protein
MLTLMSEPPLMVVEVPEAVSQRLTVLWAVPTFTVVLPWAARLTATGVVSWTLTVAVPSLVETVTEPYWPLLKVNVWSAGIPDPATVVPATTWTTSWLPLWLRVMVSLLPRAPPVTSRAPVSGLYTGAPIMAETKRSTMGVPRPVTRS